MEIEQFRQIKRKNEKTLERLIETHSKCAWFLSFHAVQDVAVAAPMMISAWTKVLENLFAAKEHPKESFMALLAAEILRMLENPPESDNAFSALDPPEVHSRFRIFTAHLKEIEAKKRTAYLCQTFGSLSTAAIAEILGCTPEYAKEIIQDASSEIMQYAKKERKSGGTDLITLSTAFRSSDGKGLDGIQVPVFLIASLRHSMAKYANLTKNTTGKEKTKMSTPAPKKKKSGKTRKIIITVAVVCLLAAGIGFAVTRLAAQNQIAAEITTTYKAEEITYGDVDTTISGSGNLSPITNEILSCENPCTVSTIHAAVGDTVEDGDVIAVVTAEITETVMNEETREMTENVSEEEVEIKAPCDGIVTELPVYEGDQLQAGSEIAIVMGTDGFTLNLSVDELDIANVTIGQEVTVTVDAVNGTYTGEVSNLSYNGSSSGGTTSYQIAASIDYAEGIYSGMSASAEIVIESSGEGLLVPVDAVRTSGDESYVYLAPSDAESGSEYTPEELTLDDLTKCTVETGMSDGSYIMIESDELAEGDLIILTEVSTTATGSDSESSSSFGGRGGMGGMGGMGFGEGDFSDFDPSQMPQGGGFGGGMGSFGG